MPPYDGAPSPTEMHLSPLVLASAMGQGEASAMGQGEASFANPWMW
jgi:hypothetical protein